jgi:hypothetical protein
MGCFAFVGHENSHNAAVERNKLAIFGLEIGALFWQDSTLYGADLETNATVNAGRKINPIPVRTNGVFTRAFNNAGYWAGANAVSNPFANIRDDRVRHRKN